MGDINCPCLNGQAAKKEEYEKVTNFLKQNADPARLEKALEDKDISLIEVAEFLDASNEGALTTADAEKGIFICPLFKEVATILKQYKFKMVYSIRPENIDCDKVPCSKEEKKLVPLLNSPKKAVKFIKNIKGDKCRGRMVWLSATKFISEGNFKKAEAVANLTQDPYLKDSIQTRIKAAQSQKTNNQ